MIIGCYDINIDNSRALAEKYNIKVYKDNLLNALLETKPHIVSICTPDDSHFQITMSILNSKFIPNIIFLEKPACINENELNTLLSKSDEKKVKLVVNHSRRFDFLHRSLRKKILDNTYGELIRVDAIYYSGWSHNGLHTIDTLSFLFEDEIILEKLINSYRSPYYNDPNLEFICSFKRNRVPIFISTMNEKYYQLFEFDIKFANSRIRIEDFGNRVFYEKKITNHMHENVLIESNLDIVQDNKHNSPMKSAINKIVESLDRKSKLDGYLLKDVAKTMNKIWEGKKWQKI